jgi:transposase-like protein
MGARQTKGWREKVQQQLQVVQQWKQSGQSIVAWAAAHGIDAKLLMGWVAYEGRWLRRLQSDLVGSPTRVSQQANANTVNVDSTSPAQAGSAPKGFVAAHSVPLQSPRLPNQPPTCNPLEKKALPGAARASVRIEYALAGTGTAVVLLWPVDHGHELASWLKAMSA